MSPFHPLLPSPTKMLEMRTSCSSLYNRLTAFPFYFLPSDRIAWFSQTPFFQFVPISVDEIVFKM